MPGISGIDTRMLTQKIRDGGAQLATIMVDEHAAPTFEDPNQRNLVAEASCDEPKIYGEGNPYRVLLVDCGLRPLRRCAPSRPPITSHLRLRHPSPRRGNDTRSTPESARGSAGVHARPLPRTTTGDREQDDAPPTPALVRSRRSGLKYNMIRCFVSRGAEVKVVPWNHDISSEEYDGLFVSNGPGDPAMADETVVHLKKVLGAEEVKPTFGICMGNQLIARAAGPSPRCIPSSCSLRMAPTPLASASDAARARRRCGPCRWARTARRGAYRGGLGGGV